MISNMETGSEQVKNNVDTRMGPGYHKLLMPGSKNKAGQACDLRPSSSDEEAMPTVRPVAEDKARGRVRRIFQDIKATKGVERVPDFWRTLANYPEMLEQVWTELKHVMAPGKLDALTKEMIALAVSITNGCDYCINSHTAAVKRLGLEEEGFGEFMAVVALFNKTNTLADGFQIEPDVKPVCD